MPGPPLGDRMTRFKADLTSTPAPTIVQRHITFGDCYLLSPDDHFQLKALIAEHFSIHTSEVVVVGSGKLGFSIAPDKRYREFGETSDLDVALVSDRLFDRIWNELFEYDRDGRYWPAKDEFRRYLFRGWIRPDKLPPSHYFRSGADWWKFFLEETKAQRFGPYRITGALYRTWRHLEGYQEFAVRACQAEERAV
jgi:hypothetical protein